MTETPPSELPIVDLGDAALWQDPAAALANAREAAPLARTARGERVVLRYSETEQLLADPRMRTVGGRLLDGIGIHDGPLNLCPSRRFDALRMDFFFASKAADESL